MDESIGTYGANKYDKYVVDASNAMGAGRVVMLEKNIATGMFGDFHDELGAVNCPTPLDDGE